MHRFFTADLRLGDRDVIATARRPFVDVDEMDDALIDAINDTVQHDDELWILGDLATGDLARALDRAHAIHGRKRLLLSDDDIPSRFVARSGRAEAIAAFAEAGIDVIDAHWLRWDFAGETALLSHLPYIGSTDSAPADNAPAYTGLPLVHGHGYGAVRLRPKQFNVGVDANWFAPVPEEQILAWLNRGAGARP